MRPTAPRQAVAEARAAETAARPPVQEARRRACPHRDRSAHAGENPQCGERGPVSRRARADRVERGFETALGAALGEDLEAALDAQRAGRIGATATVAPAIPRCRKACRASPAVVRAPRSLRAGWRRSASSTLPTARGFRSCLRPASGWSAGKARCGAGMA